MDKKLENNLIESYQVDGGFIVHDCQMLEKLFLTLDIDPKTSVDSRIFELEGVSHFFQQGVMALAKKMKIARHDYVLCLGDGSGAPSRLLAKMAGCRVAGVDINPDQISKARACAVLHGLRGKVDYYLQNVEELSLKKKDFTKALCNETCCHWQDKEKAFLRIKVHLQEGAIVGFNTWLRGDQGTLNNAYGLVPEFKGLYKKGIWFQEDLSVYKRLLEQSGFKVLEIKDVTDKIDIKMRARLKAGLQWSRYEAAMGSRAKESGLHYYTGMLKTHYDFLRYGVIIAEKPKR